MLEKGQKVHFYVEKKLMFAHVERLVIRSELMICFKDRPLFHEPKPIFLGLIQRHEGRGEARLHHIRQLLRKFRQIRRRVGMRFFQLVGRPFCMLGRYISCRHDWIDGWIDEEGGQDLAVSWFGWIRQFEWRYTMLEQVWPGEGATFLGHLVSSQRIDVRYANETDSYHGAEILNALGRIYRRVPALQK